MPWNGPKPEENYMCVETGVGSGSVYYAKDLFLSYKDAMDECNRRNLKEV